MICANLVRSAPRFARPVYYITFRFVCQGVFQKFFQLFSRLFRSVPLAFRRKCPTIISHLFSFVKRFFKSFSTFFRDFFRGSFLSESDPAIISHLFSFVKRFLKVFSTFFVTFFGVARTSRRPVSRLPRAPLV